MREREDVLRDIYLAAQEGMTFPGTITGRLVVYWDKQTGLLVCGGRVQIFRDRVPEAPQCKYSSYLMVLGVPCY